MEINKESLENLTPEQIMELAEKAQLADELKSKHEQAEADKLKLVDELKDERTKKQLAEAALASNANNSEVVDEQKAREIFKSIINEEKTTQSEMSRQSFEAQFKASNPEFDTSNDPGGIKYDAFKRVLSRFNVANTPVEQLPELYSDAMILFNKGKNTQPSVNNNPYAFSSKSSGSSPIVTIDNDLSLREIKLIESAGWTKEKYLKMKLAQPHFVRQILDQVRD